MTHEAKKTTKTTKEQKGFFKTYRELVQPEEIIEAGCRLGVIKRQRKIDLPSLVEATIGSLSPIPGTQTTILTNYLTLTGEPIAPSSFYDRFTEPYAQLMAELSQRAIRAVEELNPPGIKNDYFGVLLENFSQIKITDSTSYMIKRLAKDWAPSTSKKRPAGIKIHSVITLQNQLPIENEITPQKTHDSKAFNESVLEPGTLSMFDMGYLKVERFIDAIQRGAHFLTPLKSTHDPIIVLVHISKGPRRKVKGKTIDEAIEENLLIAKNKVIDLDVRLEAEEKEAIARVVALMDNEGEFHWYLTTIPREILTGQDVGEAYRLRWVIELFFKHLKSGAGLSAILSWREQAITALIHAKIVALALARLLEIHVKRKNDKEVYGKLAMVLVLSRSVPLLLSYSLMSRGVTLEQLEERIMMIAEMVSKSRSRRRERERRKREQALGKGP